jgi:hypothetical protein
VIIVRVEIAGGDTSGGLVNSTRRLRVTYVRQVVVPRSSGASGFPTVFGGSAVLVSRSNTSGVAGPCAATWVQVFVCGVLVRTSFGRRLGAVLVDMSCGATPVTRTGLPFIIDQRAVPRNLHFGGHMLRYFHYYRFWSARDLEPVGTRPVFILDRDDVTIRG